MRGLWVVQAPEGPVHHHGDTYDDPEGKNPFRLSEIRSDREAGSITNHRCARPRQQAQGVGDGFSN
jgi:hypothetical protein